MRTYFFGRVVPNALALYRNIFAVLASTSGGGSRDHSTPTNGGRAGPPRGSFPAQKPSHDGLRDRTLLFGSRGQSRI
eukprot:GSA25T00017998001.1